MDVEYTSILIVSRTMFQ